MAASAISQDIASLMKQINSTTDAKGIAELQARINSETAAIQNEQTKLQMYALAAAAEDKIIAQQQRSSSVQRADADSQYLDLEADD